MLAQAKTEDEAPKAVKAKGDFAGRFGAWWNGVDYVPPVPGEADAEAEEKAAAKKAKAEKPEKAEKAEKAEKPEKKKPEKPKLEVVAEAAPEATEEKKPEPVSPETVSDAAAVRMKALETLWGEGRLTPGSFTLDTLLLDTVLETADKPGDIGFLGVDPALLNAFAAQSDRKARVGEWRSGCAVLIQAQAPKADVAAADLDRPKMFADGQLEGLVSCEAFAYADHKAGMVGRACRALTETGRWVFLDTTRTTKKTPPEAFASAWAEPQLSGADEIEELLKLAGFASVQRVPVTGQVIDAARQGYAGLAQILETAAQTGMNGREGALFLQELAWEAQSWRARLRALEGGALEVNIWIADKTPREVTPRVAMTEAMLDTPVEPDDAGAADTLFDKGN